MVSHCSKNMLNGNPPTHPGWVRVPSKVVQKPPSPHKAPSGFGGRGAAVGKEERVVAEGLVGFVVISCRQHGGLRIWRA